MSVIIFFSASKNIFFCRNDVQAIDFLRKGSYAPVLYSSTVAHYPASQPANPSLPFLLNHGGKLIVVTAVTTITTWRR
jgi:hypothetical protein